MVVCKFWQQGNCRKGNLCTFEHPNNQQQTRFGGNPGAFGSRTPFGGGGGGTQSQRWTINPEDVRADLTNNRPNWILSAYGPGKDTPATLFTENEYSPEEIRARFYQQQNAGNAESADQEAISLWTKATKDMQDVAAKANDVVKYMEEQEDKHPNRYDFCKADGTKPREEVAKDAEMNSKPGSSMNPFGGGNTAFGGGSNPFSKPAFGQSTFGQPSQPSTQSAFGKPTFGGGSGGSSAAPATTNPFSRPAFGAPGFGQPAQPAPAFGQSGFGQASQSASGFGQPAKPTSAFGQPSGIGQGVSSNPFAKPTAASTTTTPAFGQPTFGTSTTPQSAFGQQQGSIGTGGFGQGQGSTSASAFGQPQGSTGTSAFGQQQGSTGMSAFGQQATGGSGASPFSQPQGGTTQSSGFGQPSQQSQPAFGQSGFGSQKSTTSGFGAAGSGSSAPAFGQASGPSSFGAPRAPGFGQPAASPFGQQGSSGGFGGSTSGSAFGSGGGFGSAGTGSSGGFGSGGGFGQPAAPISTSAEMDAAPTIASPTTSVFGVTTAPQPSAVTASSFGQLQPKPSVAPRSGDPNPLTGKPSAPLHYSETLGPLNLTLAPNRQPVQYRGQRVIIHEKEEAKISGVVEVVERIPTYQRPDTRKDERIWFPHALKDEKVENVNKAVDHYHDLQGNDDEYSENVLEQFKHLFNEGKWKDHKIPLVPPKRDWIEYDF